MLLKLIVDHFAACVKGNSSLLPENMLALTQVRKWGGGDGDGDCGICEVNEQCKSFCNHFVTDANNWFGKCCLSRLCGCFY